MCQWGRLGVTSDRPHVAPERKLDTVGKRFGGSYYRMILVASHGISKSKEARADAIGIKVVKDISSLTNA